MAKFRALLKRRRSVQNIRKITRTMQLISTARFQQAFNRAMALRAYADRFAHMAADLAEHGGSAHPLLQPGRGAGREALLLITSDRGLCGGYNSQVLSAALAFLADRPEIELSVVGKKGINSLRFRKRSTVAEYTKFDEPTRERVDPIADGYMTDFLAGRLDRVSVAYMRFWSTARQSPEIVTLLPIETPTGADGRKGPAAGGPVRFQLDYEFDPDPEELLAAFLPEAVRVRLYQSFLEAAVSEHVARMVAMKAATDNAGEMIRHLGRLANKARQAQITGELTELMAGAGSI